MIDYKERNKKIWETRRKNGTDIPWNKGKKLSQVCWNKGKTASNESKARMSAAKKGKYVGDKSPNWKGGKPLCMDCGKTVSSYAYKRCMKCARAYFKGEKGGNWRGGLTKIGTRLRLSTEYKNWRNLVLERDNHTCVWCGTKENLQVDHIKPFALYPELRLDVSNGRVLCKPCHKTTDTFCIRYKKTSIISNAA